MRWIVVATVLALSSVGIGAAELAATEDQSAEVSTPVIGDAGVTVTAIPSHSMMAELVKELKPSPEMRPSRRVAQHKPLPKSLLSRTERHQMVLLVAPTKSGKSSLLDILNDEDADQGSDDLDLQRSYSRPKVVEVDDSDEDSHDQGLSEAVKLRLFLARQQAVRAHEKKFG